MRFALLLIVAATVFPGVTRADPPNVVTDIAPVHSLVAQVMDGVGVPDLLLPPGASPHAYAMRPSEARALQNADMVVWIGPGLTPWLEKPVETLAGEVQQITLADVAGTRVLPVREELGGGHDHDDDHGEAHDDGHHDDHGEDHNEGGDDDHGDDHGDNHADNHSDEHDSANDPHLWLDPENAQVWLSHMADQLSELDPENAETYAKNAANAVRKLDAQIQKLETQLEPLRGASVFVYHDAFQYFEKHFGFAVAGAISDSDAVAPSAARLAELRETLKASNVSCLLSEPQYNSGLVDALDGDLSVAILDPLGVEFPTGQDQYGMVMQSLADGLTACLQGT